MESELVGGFFTEHSSVPFVFFFLSEYSSIVLFSTLTAILFLGGYNFSIGFGSYLNFLDILNISAEVKNNNSIFSFLYDTIAIFNNSIEFINENIFSFSSIVLGLKTCLFCFFFVWFRATLPRLRYDQLIDFCWLHLLPLIIAFIVLIPSLLLTFKLIIGCV